ncbi:hydroxypyruvate isomerase family protein [Candidatus Latescibacterota bacterium]
MKQLSRRKILTSASVALLTGGMTGTTSALSKISGDLSSIGKTPHTKFAVNIEMWWTDLDFIERIRQTATLGFPAVEMWDYESKDIDDVRNACDKYGIILTQFTAWGFNPGMNNPSNHKQFEEKIRESCTVAKKLNCSLATVVGGDNQPGMTENEMHTNIIIALKQVAPIVEDNGLTLILEPMNIRVDHKGHSLYGSESAVRICREVDSPNVKINWDLYHMHITEGDLCGHLRDGFDQIGYIQIADHPGRNEPGTGEIYYPRVLKEVYNLGYRGYVGLECRPLGDHIEAARRIALADQW